MTKITKKQMFMAVINAVENGVFEFEDAEGNTVEVTKDEILTFANHEIETLDKRREKSKEYAAKKKAEDPLMDKVKEVLTDEYMTIADIVEAIGDEDVTVNKVISRMTKLVGAGEVEKTDVKVEATEGKKARTVKAYRWVQD